MIDPADLQRYKRIAQLSDGDEAGFRAAGAGPRPGKEPPDEPTPGDHGPDPDEPLA